MAVFVGKVTPTAQLRDMEENGLVSRKVYAEVPPRVEYSLTSLGKSLQPILDAMWDWGEEYKASLKWTQNDSIYPYVEPKIRGENSLISSRF